MTKPAFIKKNIISRGHWFSLFIMITRNPKSCIFMNLSHVCKMALQMTIFEIPSPIQWPKLFVEFEVPIISPTYLPFKSQ